jgi:hypothetical protein
MNLVQINERLKDLPPQVLQQYANGMNPEVPPYLALGELQRRELSQKKMAATQGGAQGQQPSIKEQVEQKAGLMALQQMQQQQVAQQQAQPQGPMPTPAGVPQPQQQPEAPMMAARGGLATIPVRRDMFEYARGGIIAFANGGDTMGTPSLAQQELAAQAAELAAVERKDAAVAKKIAELEKKASELDYSAPEVAEQVRAQIAALKGSETPKSAPSAPPAARQAPPPQVDKNLQSGLLAAAKKAPSAGPRPPEASAPRPAAAPINQPPAAQSPLNEASKLAMDAARKPAEAMTPEQAMAQEGKFASQYGLDKKFGEEERGLMALMKQRQADYAKNRPMEELSATLRGFGQGYGGASAAGERASRETYEMDMANQREALNAVNALNKENLATGKARYASSSNLFGEDQKSTSAANRERMQSLAQLAGVDERRIQSELDRMTQVQIQMMKDAAAKLDRSTPGKGERMLAQVLALRAAGKNAEADRIIETINALEGRGGKEDTFTKKMEAERVRIAGSMMTPEMKKKALDDLDALEKRGSGGGGGSSGVIDKNNPLLK